MSRRWWPRSLCVVLTWLSLAIITGSGEARPKYENAFDKLYHKVRENKKLDCTVCHCRDANRKNRNHYGEALAKELGKKDVKDGKTIVEALKAIEDGECKTGKWKLRLEEGLLPCTCGCDTRDENAHITRLPERGRTE